MDAATVITWVAVLIGMAAGVIQVVDYVQKVREKRQAALSPPPSQVQQPPAMLAPTTIQEPPPPSLPRTNLPAQPTPLVGRTREIASIEDILRRSDVRLVTLTGPGGVGKSRLSIHVGEDLLDDYADGVFFVPLSSISDPDLLVPTIAHVLGVKEAGAQPLINTLKSYLRDKNLLLILDNFEQLVDAAPLIAELLSSAPRVNMLVTSQADLRLSGEREIPISPLDLPDPERLPPLDALSSNEAVALFVQRAQAVKPDFTLTSENAQAVAEICVRLDGLPLAIELAAARSKLLSPRAILDRLRTSFDLLSSGASGRRDLPARQQTLQNAIAWSYNLLTPDEQTLFRRLSIFVGGCTLDAAEVVAGAVLTKDEGRTTNGNTPNSKLEVEDLIESLLDKSLLRETEQLAGEPRFWLLSTIRAYGLSKLEERGEGLAIRKAHAEYYLRLVEEAEPQLIGPQQVEWLHRVEAEHNNIRAAIDWSKSPEGDLSVGLRISGALLWFWQTRGYLREGRERLSTLLDGSSELRVTSYELDQDVQDQQLVTRNSELVTMSKALVTAGRLATLQGDYTAARDLFEENLEIQRTLGDEGSISHALVALGSAVAGQGDYATAASLYEESLPALRASSKNPYAPMALVGLGEARLAGGDYEQARPLLDESLQIFREQGNKAGEGFALYNLAHVALDSGDLDRAATLFRESLALRHELGNRQSIALCLVGLAEVACAQDDMERAATLLGSAQTLLEATGTIMGAHDQVRYDGVLTTIRARLGDSAWSTSLNAGRSMSLEDALTYALSSPTKDGRRQTN
jgi:predicted ATPase